MPPRTLSGSWAAMPGPRALCSPTARPWPGRWPSRVLTETEPNSHRGPSTHPRAARRVRDGKHCTVSLWYNARMRRCSRTRRFLKRAGLAASTLVMIAWVTSMFFQVIIVWTINDWACRVESKIGYVGIDWAYLPGFGSTRDYYSDWDGRGKCDVYLVRGVRWHQRPGFRWPRVASGPHWRWVWLPYWLILMAAAIPTAVLLRRDRPPPMGHCQSCGYSLMGNESGVCPECGRATHERSPREDDWPPKRPRPKTRPGGCDCCAPQQKGTVRRHAQDAWRCRIPEYMPVVVAVRGTSRRSHAIRYGTNEMQLHGKAARYCLSDCG